MNQLYLQIIHRVAFVIAIIPATVMALLPKIYPDEKDLDFAKKAYDYLETVVRGALLILMVTGFFRLPEEIPFIIVIKMIFAGSVFVVFFLYRSNIKSDYYLEFSTLKILLMLITGLIGLSV